MKLKLTEKQVVLLGWDASSTSPDPVKVNKGGWTYDLNPERLAEVRCVAECLAWGSDPGTMSAAKAILRKINKV